jgi:hypothetical protein
MCSDARPCVSADFVGIVIIMTFVLQSWISTVSLTFDTGFRYDDHLPAVPSLHSLDLGKTPLSPSTQPSSPASSASSDNATITSHCRFRHFHLAQDQSGAYCAGRSISSQCSGSLMSLLASSSHTCLPLQGSLTWYDDLNDVDDGMRFLDAARFLPAIDLGDETAAKIQRAWRQHKTGSG